MLAFGVPYEGQCRGTEFSSSWGDRAQSQASLRSEQSAQVGHGLPWVGRFAISRLKEIAVVGHSRAAGTTELFERRAWIASASGKDARMSADCATLTATQGIAVNNSLNGRGLILPTTKPNDHHLSNARTRRTPCRRCSLFAAGHTIGALYVARTRARGHRKRGNNALSPWRSIT